MFYAKILASEESIYTFHLNILTCRWINQSFLINDSLLFLLLSSQRDPWWRGLILNCCFRKQITLRLLIYGLQFNSHWICFFHYQTYTSHSNDDYNNNLLTENILDYDPCQVNWLKFSSLLWTTDQNNHCAKPTTKSKFGTDLWVKAWTSYQCLQFFSLLTCTLSTN